MDRSRLALRLEDVYKERAKANLATSTGGSNPRPLANSPKAEPVNTREELAKLAGIGSNTISRIKTIEAKATQEQKADLTAGNFRGD